MNNDENVILTTNTDLVQPFIHQFHKLWSDNLKRIIYSEEKPDKRCDEIPAEWS